MIEKLFFLYIAVAIAYNMVSLAFKEITGKQLSPSEPLPSITLLTTLYLVFVSGGIPDYARNFLLVIFALIIFRLGILKHLINYEPGLYFSIGSRISAAIINIFGVLLLAISPIL